MKNVDALTGARTCAWSRSFLSSGSPLAYLHPPFAKVLNETRILTGFPLGYWLASQGSLVVFVVLIFFYAWYMNNVLDKKYGMEEEESRTEDAEP